jgi:hypothetical protein
MCQSSNRTHHLVRDLNRTGKQYIHYSQVYTGRVCSQPQIPICTKIITTTRTTNPRVTVTVQRYLYTPSTRSCDYPPSHLALVLDGADTSWSVRAILPSSLFNHRGSTRVVRHSLIFPNTAHDGCHYPSDSFLQAYSLGCHPRMIHSIRRPMNHQSRSSTPSAHQSLR